MVDLRASNKVSSSIRCFRNGINTLSLHPLNENLFTTCSVQG